MPATLIALGILVLAALVVIVSLIANAGRDRRRIEDIPPAMRPGYSDEQLETRVLERYMGWGVVLTLFFALFLPIYGFREGSRIAGKDEADFISTAVRGEELYVANCARCHGQTLAGGGAPSPYNVEDSWPAPALNNVAKRYEPSENITDIRDFVTNTITRGRPGTPMPSWGAQYQGPLNDQQIDDITTYVLSQQIDEVAQPTAATDMSGEELYIANCARCHGANLNGVVGPSLIGAFERHDEQTLIGILRNGILLPGTPMPPWQVGYQETPYTDDALQRIVDYLRERQPAELPEDAGQYQTPGLNLEGAGSQPEPAASATDV